MAHWVGHYCINLLDLGDLNNASEVIQAEPGEYVIHMRGAI